jgi:DNA polymerase-3 subunit delta'
LIGDWERLWSHPGGLPHALLLAGPAGLGKRDFAEALARRMLCERSTGSEPACDECDACRWFEAGNHPDFRRLIPEADAEEVESDEAPAKTEKPEKKKSSQIRVEQVRALADFVYVGAHRARGRVIIAQPAEAMNAAAANSLLKILEEPPSSIYFILISDAYRRLLPTIRSRCSQVVMGRPEPQVARDWLKKTQPDAASLLDVTGGMPLRALTAGEQGWKRIVASLEAALVDVDQDEMSLATAWEGMLKNAEGFGMDDLITLLQKWLGDLLGWQMAGRTRFFAGSDAAMTKLLGRSSVPALLHCYSQLQSARALANHPLNLRLFLEDLAARYLATFAGNRASR